MIFVVNTTTQFHLVVIEVFFDDNSIDNSRNESEEIERENYDDKSDRDVCESCTPDRRYDLKSATNMLRCNKLLV